MQKLGLLILVLSFTVLSIIACSGKSGEIERLGERWSFQPLTFEYDDSEFNVLYAEDTAINSPDTMEVLILTDLDNEHITKVWIAYDLVKSEVLYTIYTRKETTIFQVPRDGRQVTIIRDYEFVHHSNFRQEDKDYYDALMRAILERN